MPSGVAEQPLSIEETAKGAKNRAKAAHSAAIAEVHASGNVAIAQAAASGGAGPAGSGRQPVLGIGIESGLFVLDGTHFDVCVASAYDGAKHHLGDRLLACSLLLPPPPRLLSRSYSLPLSRLHLALLWLLAGLSCAFEIPPAILKHVVGKDGGCDLSEVRHGRRSRDTGVEAVTWLPLLLHLAAMTCCYDLLMRRVPSPHTQACNRSGITSDPKLGEHGGLIGLLSSGRLTREAYTVQALSTALFFASEAGRPWH